MKYLTSGKGERKMIKIEFGNVNAKIHNLNAYPLLKAKIIKICSWQDGGFGAPMVTKCCANAKTNMIYTGVIPYVIKFAKKMNIPYELIDRRVIPQSGDYYELAEGIQLRDYQAKVIANISPRKIIQAATGAGKTCIMAAIIANYNVRYPVIVAPDVSLANQLSSEISKFLGIEVGLLTGTQKNIKDVMVVTADAALKQKTVLDRAEMLLYDECQFLGATTIFNTARVAKNAYYRFGMSATPWRDGNDSILIHAAVNVPDVKSRISATELIRAGKLTPCDIMFVEQEDACGWAGSYNKTYVSQIVNNESRNNKIMNIVAKEFDTFKAANRTPSILLLISRCEHGWKLLNMLREKFSNSNFDYEYKGITYHLNTFEFVDGSADIAYRNAVFQATREGKVQILIGSTIADAGLDIPRLESLILCASGRSSTRCFQRIGRVIRLFEGKKRARVYDFYDKNYTFAKHSLIRRALYRTEEEFGKNIYMLDDNLNKIKKW